MIEYRFDLDKNDVIQNVSPEWVAFAIANGAAGLPERVVGRALWGFIADAETRHLYAEIFASVREGTGSVRVPFRCDSPDRRRFMRLTVHPAEADGLKIVSQLLREERRDPVELLSAEVRRGSELLRMCGWCKRILTNAEWMEIEVTVRRFGLFDPLNLPRISHGICPDCSRSVEAVLDAGGAA